MFEVNSFLIAQKAIWVKILLQPGKAIFKIITPLYLKNVLGPDTFECNMGCVEEPENLPGFY